MRHDILTQLQLRDPDKYIASFHRPNLRYLVRSADSVKHTALLVTALRHYSEGNVIVYSPTINKVEETVDFLEDQGIAATGYHAKMDAGERRRNQERWMSDEVRVLVGTIAFGLGINKATVRAVDSSGAAEIGGTVLSRGGTCRARWKTGGLLIALAKAGCRTARLFREPNYSTRRSATVRGSDITPFEHLRNVGIAAIGRSACILARRRSGRRVMDAMSAERRQSG